MAQTKISPGSPGVGPVCQGVDDGQEPVHRDDDHHKARDVESEDPAKKIGEPCENGDIKDQ